MSNIKNADCGFNPDDFGHFKEVTVTQLTNANGFDLATYRNMHIDLSAETADVEIADFNNMVSGAHYTLVAANGATKQFQVKFPANSTLYSEDITPANGMTIVYNFFTDDKSIYCERAIYS